MPPSGSVSVRARVVGAGLRVTSRMLFADRGTGGTEADLVALKRARARMDGGSRIAGRQPRLTTETVALPNCSATWFRALGAPADGAVLYLHGGAYVAGSTHSHREMFRLMVTATGLAVLGVDYRLAPEHRFPAWLDDAYDAYRYLTDERGIAPERIVVAGDSAGGGLTLALLLRLRDAGDPQPACAVAFSPWADLTCSSASFTSNASLEAMIEPEGLAAEGILAARGADVRDPYVSPVFGDFTGLCPLFVNVGSGEILLDDSRAVRDAATKAGVRLNYSEWPGMVHVFPLFARFVPEARAAIDDVAGFVGDHLA